MDSNINNLEILQYAIEHDILNADDVREQIMKKKNEAYLKQHEEKHKIWYDDKAGQWMTYFDEPTSKRGIVLKRRKNKVDLEKLIVNHYRELEDNPCVRDIFQEWVDMKFNYKEITPQTKTRYENDFNRFFSENNPISMKPIADITELELEMFIKGCIRRYNLTRKTYNGLKTLVRGIFRYAKKKKLTTISISVFFDELDLPKNIFHTREKLEDEDEVYTEDEIQVIKEYLLQKNSIRYLGVLLVFVSGLRVGELAALKPEDISMLGNYGKIHVRRTEVHYNVTDENGKKKNVVTVQEFPKSDAGDRYILLNAFAIKVLKLISAQNPNPKEYIFEDQGNRIKIKGFSKALWRTCQTLGIPFRPMHKVRKTYGTLLIDNGVSEALVAKQMGHTDISTTKKYYYRNNQNEKHRVEEIERALSAM